MRSAYGAIFVGFTVMGFASVFNAHGPATQHSKNLQRANPVRLALTAAPANSTAPATDDAITIQTELVEPQIVGPKIGRQNAPLSVAAVSRPVMRQRASDARSSRSLFSRVLFGDGQYRPQPFPKPAGMK